MSSLFLCVQKLQQIVQEERVAQILHSSCTNITHTFTISNMAICHPLCTHPRHNNHIFTISIITIYQLLCTHTVTSPTHLPCDSSPSNNHSAHTHTIISPTNSPYQSSPSANHSAHTRVITSHTYIFTISNITIYQPLCTQPHHYLTLLYTTSEHISTTAQHR